MFLAGPTESIAIVKWSNGTINKFYANQQSSIKNFINVKQKWYPELSFEIAFHQKKELSDNNYDGTKL